MVITLVKGLSHKIYKWLNVLGLAKFLWICTQTLLFVENGHKWNITQLQ
jgi:hypothetical protein